MNVRYTPISSTIYDARDIEFSPDGTKMLVATYYSTGSDYIQQYSLTVPWNICTSSVSYTLTSSDTIPEAVRYNSDGTKLYVLGNGSDKIYEYTLSPAWTLNGSTAIVSMNNLAYVGFQDTDTTGLHFNDDGTKVYILGNGTNSVWQYTLEIPWSINSMNIGYCSTYSTAYDSYGIKFNPDGTTFYQTADGVTYNYIVQANLTSNEWNICSRNFIATINSPDVSPSGIAFKSDGSRMYLTGTSGDRVYEYILSTPWSIGGTVTQVTHNNNTYVGNFELSPYGIDISSDGTRMIMVGRQNNAKILQFDINTPWIIDTMQIGYKSILSQESISYGMTISYDGSKVYIIGGGNDTIYQYSLTTPFNLGSFVYDSKSLNIGAVVPDARDIFINKPGTKIYVVCQTNDRIYQYNMSTPFDITTATYSNKNIYISHIEGLAEGLTFSQNFERIITVGRSANTAYQFNLIN